MGGRGHGKIAELLGAEHYRSAVSTTNNFSTEAVHQSENAAIGISRNRLLSRPFMVFRHDQVQHGIDMLAFIQSASDIFSTQSTRELFINDIEQFPSKLSPTSKQTREGTENVNEEMKYVSELEFFFSKKKGIGSLRSRGIILCLAAELFKNRHAPNNIAALICKCSKKSIRIEETCELIGSLSTGKLS